MWNWLTFVYVFVRTNLHYMITATNFFDVNTPGKFGGFHYNTTSSFFYIN